VRIAASDIYPVSDFSRKPPEHIARLKESRRPEVLTVDGKAAVVVQEVQAYEEMVETLDTLEKIAGAAKAFDSGEGIPSSEAFKALGVRLAAKYPDAKV
jgi:hypothetical protein